MSNLFTPETFWLDFTNVVLGVVCGLLLLAVLVACLVEVRRGRRHFEKDVERPSERVGPGEQPSRV